MSEHIAALEAAATVDSVWHCTLVGKRDLIAVLAELQRLRAENETFRQRYVTQTAYDAVKEELAAVRVENEALKLQLPAETIWGLWKAEASMDKKGGMLVVAFARAVEAAHIKAAQAAKERT
jgi:hypothetical protein